MKKVQSDYEKNDKRCARDDEFYKLARLTQTIHSKYYFKYTILAN